MPMSKSKNDLSDQFYKPDEFRLPVQHLNEFKLSDKVSLKDALDTMLVKFSKAPFNIYDRDNIFMIHDGTELFLFKLEDGEGNPKFIRTSSVRPMNNASFPSIRRIGGSSMADQRPFGHKGITLTVLGVDPPSS